jgi:UDPglucose 6-dehydrogenase
MKISIIGTGYVGLVTGICLASLGFNVLCCDSDREKIEKLKKGVLPIYEPGLDSLLAVCMKQKGLLEFTEDIKTAAAFSDILFITVNTPTLDDNSSDLSHVFDVVSSIACCMKGYKILVNKSTVPPGTGRKVRERMEKLLEAQQKQLDFDVVSNPEFLREGSAVHDFFHSDRIVLGAESERAVSRMEEVYRDQLAHGIPMIITGLETAEMIKYASNAFLAAKIGFINEIANLCEACGANVSEVAAGMGFDGRIGREFLNPGPGFGGSCFPKDVRALKGMAQQYGYEPVLLNSILESNRRQAERMAEKIWSAAGGLEGRKAAVLGLSFKPGTDDIRESPSLSIIRRLLDRKASVRVYDPEAMENTQKAYPELPLEYCQDAYEACSGSDCAILATEWKEFCSLDFHRLKALLRSPVFIDLRNVYDPSYVKSFGFRYDGVGRK